MSFPATYNIRYYKGDLYQFLIRPKTGTGEPFPISDSTHDAFFYISTQRGGSAVNTVVASASIVEGNVLATIQPSVGNSLNGNTQYFYDVSVRGKSPNNNQVYTLITGTLSVTLDITGPTT